MTTSKKDKMTDPLLILFYFVFLATNTALVLPLLVSRAASEQAFSTSYGFSPARKVDKLGHIKEISVTDAGKNHFKNKTIYYSF
jgi:hypothetical protein